MRIIIIMWCLLITACSSDSATTQPQPTVTTPVIKNVEVAEIDIASNDCVMRSNAEAEFTFNRGSALLKHLVWNCADYDFHREKFVEFLAEYDTLDACYKVVNKHIGTGMCWSAAEITEPVIFDAKIDSPGYAVYYDSGVKTTLTEYKITRWSGGYPGDFGIGMSPIIINTGNITIFGLKATIKINGVIISRNTMSRALLPANESWRGSTMWIYTNINPLFFSTPAITSGSQYTVTITLTDLYGNVLDTYTGIAVAKF